MLIEVPVDVFGEDVPEGWEHTPSYATRVGPDPADVDRAAEVLANAERPVIYAGQGVHYARRGTNSRRSPRNGRFRSPRA